MDDILAGLDGSEQAPIPAVPAQRTNGSQHASSDAVTDTVRKWARSYFRSNNTYDRQELGVRPE